MAASQPGWFNFFALTNLSDLADGYRLYTYAPSTTTQKVAYTDAAGSISHTYTSDGSGGLYIALDARGELPAPLFLTSGGYDLTLKTAAGATVWARRAYGQDDGAITLDAALRADLASTVDAAKGDALIGVRSALTGGTARTQHAKNSDVISAKDFGVVADGVANDTVALQAAFDALPVGATLHLTGDINFTSVTLSKYRTKLVGDARMRGTVNIESDGSVGQSSYFVVEGLMFHPTAEDQTVDGISLTNLAFGSIRNCKFRGVRACVNVPARATQPYFQDVNKIEITGCEYDFASYFIKSDYTGLAGNYGVGDWTIAGNRGQALVDHILGVKWDGSIISHNTFFFAIPANLGAPTATELLKRRGINLTDSPYLKIIDNQIFEAGADGILLTDCPFHSISGGTIAYPGAIISGRGVDIVWSSVPTLNAGQVSGIEIIRPSTGGVRLGANTRDTQVQNVSVIQPSSNDHAITGPTLLNEIVTVASGTVGCYVGGCFGRNGVYNFSDGTGNAFGENYYESAADNKRVRFTRTRSMLAGAGTPQTTPVDEVDRVEYDQVVTVNGIIAQYITSAATPYRTVYCRFSIGGCTLVHSATFVLKGAVNASPPAQGWMMFEIDVAAGVTREMFRSF